MIRPLVPVSALACLLVIPLGCSMPGRAIPRVGARPEPVADTGPGVPLATVARRGDLRVRVDVTTGTHRLETAEGDLVAAVVSGSRRAILAGRTVRSGRPVRRAEGGLVLPQSLARAIVAEANDLTSPGPTPDPPARAGETTSSPRAASSNPPRRGLPVWGSSRMPSGWRQPASRPWRSIVIHHSATSEGGADRFHAQHSRRWPNGLGYHFVIGNGTDTADGEIEVGPRWLRQGEGIDGAHAGTREYNRHGIGVCLVGDFTDDRPSADQLRALVDLVVRLQVRYHVPTERIVSHKAVRPEGTLCPGDLSVREIRERVRARWSLAQARGR